MLAPFSTKYSTISMFVMKHELRTDVDPESETALIFAPTRTKYLTTGNLLDTEAHHSGVTKCTVESSGFSNKPRCSMSAPQSVIKNSAISRLPRLHTTNSGAQPSRVLETISLRASFGKLQTKQRHTIVAGFFYRISPILIDNDFHLVFATHFVILSRRDLARRVPGLHNLHSSIKSFEMISKLVDKLMVCDLLVATLLFITIRLLSMCTDKSHQD